jgi:hypothetical protein
MAVREEGQYFKGYDGVRNFNDSFFRSVIVGLLSSVMNKLSVEQVVDGKRLVKRTPIFYGGSSDENFMKRNFSNYKQNFCPDDIRLVEGDISSYPRGVLKLDGISIDSGSITQEFGYGVYKVRVPTEHGDRVESRASTVKLIPIIMNFELSVLFDTEIQRLLVVEDMIKSLYKRSYFHFLYKDNKQKAVYGISEDIDSQGKFEYSYSNSETFDSRVTVSIELQTVFPIYVEPISIPAGNRFQTFDLNVEADMVTPEIVGAEILDEVNIEINQRLNSSDKRTFTHPFEEDLNFDIDSSGGKC